MIISYKYSKTSIIRRTNSQNKFFLSRLAVRSAQSIDAKSGMKMQLEQCRQALLQLHPIDQQFIANCGGAYINKFDGFE